MTALVIALVIFCIFSVGAEIQSVKTEATKYERSKMEVFREDVDTRLGRCFYFPVWIYALATDYFCRKERASE